MRLQGQRYAVLVADGVEDLEYWVSVMRLQEEGAEVVSVGSDTKEHRGKNGLVVRADQVASDATIDPFDGIVIPGGWAPDKMRRDPAIVASCAPLRSGPSRSASSATADRSRSRRISSRAGV